MKIREKIEDFDNMFGQDFKLPQDVINYLKEKNFKKIGSGFYSEVYSSPDENFVIKINKGNIDNNYLYFVDFCNEYKSPHLPKLGKIKKYDNYYFLFIEKLQKINSNIGIILDVLSMITRTTNLTNKEKFTEIVNDYLGTEYEDYDDMINNIVFGDQLLDLCKTLQQLLINVGFNSTDEVHEDNIMMRKDGTLVLTDPL